MLVMRTTEDPTDPLGKLVGAQQTLGLDHLPFAVNPFGFDGVQPRALLGQQTAYDPHAFTALFDLAVMFSEPAPDLAAYDPTASVPHEQQTLPAKSFEHSATPLEESGRYPTHGSPAHDPDPPLSELR